MQASDNWTFLYKLYKKKSLYLHLGPDFQGHCLLVCTTDYLISTKDSEIELFLPLGCKTSIKEKRANY